METNIILRFQRKYCECVQLGNVWLFVYALIRRKGQNPASYKKIGTACRAIRCSLNAMMLNTPRFPSSTALTFNIGPHFSHHSLTPEMRRAFLRLANGSFVTFQWNRFIYGI